MPYTYKRSKYSRRITVFRLGERGSGLRARGSQIQDFKTIRSDCLKKRVLFKDPDFPAKGTSIYYSQKAPPDIEWKRPGDFVNNPRFFVEGVTRFDVVQGKLGNCWMLASVASLTLNETLFYQVVPNNQSFIHKYAGVFHFRFWQFGRWIDVVIDDRLPTCNDKLLYMHSRNINEFWSALLEKAYAKLYGNYEALKGGSALEAMEDFTGGVTELYDANPFPINFYDILLKAFERRSLMSCSLEVDPLVRERQLPNGLIKGHAYSITNLKFVNVPTSKAEKIPLLRVRNPWGNESEWKGPWSDQSPEWASISEVEKKAMGLNFSDDGEFWISYKDFITNFAYVEICNLNPYSLDDEPKHSQKKWQMGIFEGSWVSGCTAGGCRNFIDTFYMNPQFRVELKDTDEDDQDYLCTMIVALMQKNRRRLRKMGQEFLKIGFVVYQLKNPEGLPKPLSTEFFKSNTFVAKSTAYINLREVTCRFKLSPGIYCIVPSTFDPGHEGDFILRVFTENKENVTTEYDEDIELDEPDEGVFYKPSNVVVIKDFETKEQNKDVLTDGGKKKTKNVIPNGILNEPDKVGVNKDSEAKKRNKDVLIKMSRKRKTIKTGGQGEVLETSQTYTKSTEVLDKSNKVDVNKASKVKVQKNGALINKVQLEITVTTDEKGQISKTAGTSTKSTKQKVKTKKEKFFDEEFKEFFTKIAGEDMEVDCYELHEVLNYTLKKGFKQYKKKQFCACYPFMGCFKKNNIKKPKLEFSLDVCRSMVAMMDIDRSGKLGFEEFKSLWIDIHVWEDVFEKYDIDKSGSLSTVELRHALHSAGYHLNFHILTVLILRYGRNGKISFVDFITCAVRLKTMIEMFHDKDPLKKRKATFTLNEWVENTMYA